MDLVYFLLVVLALGIISFIAVAINIKNQEAQ